jgi:NAD(P)-dependent dehydrogenase (short-subunit alcohol dehydrogenase family)/quercetin dioxygenase-like cupin family protein
MITGASQGFGHELVRAALQRGDSVIATSRNPQKVVTAFKEASDRLLAVSMDLRDPAQIAAAVQAALARFGRIDVLVNNAGHGLLGAVEEASDAEITNVFETNVFGLLRVTREVLPHFRERRSGHVVNLSSIGGLIGLAGFGIYNSTKFAVEGLSEALAKEAAPLGIRVTIVEPGPFRTNFLGGSLDLAGQTLSDYDQTSGRTRAAAVERNGNQPGDPVRAAEAIIKAVTSENPPLHLLLGKFAYENATAKLESLRQEFETWREATLSSDFPTPGEGVGKKALIPPDDLRRKLTAAQPDAKNGLTHISLAGDTYTILVNGSETAGRYCLIDMHVPPGGGPPPHRHDFEEMFAILEGEIELTFRGERSVGRTGETLNIPANAPHSFKNLTKGPARLLCMCAPAGLDEFFKLVGDIVPSRTAPPPELSEAEKAERQGKAEALAPRFRTEMLKA